MKSFTRLALIIVLTATFIGIGAIARAGSFHHDGDAWLGVVTRSVDYDIAEAFDLDVKYGVIVNEVVDDSPAAEVGLQVDDVIIALDEHEITDYDDLVDWLSEYEPGETVTLGVIRNGEKLDLQVELAERPRGGKLRKAARFFDFGKRNSYCSRMPYIGVHVTDLTRQLGEFFGIEHGRGALISEIEEDSPAAEAGLRAGDVIVGIDSDRIRDAEDVVEYISETEPGDRITVALIREKAELTLEIEVDETHNESRYGGQYDFDFSPYVSIPPIPPVPPIPNIDIDALRDLDIRVPDFRSGYPGSVDCDRGEFNREMRKLQRELEKMQSELRDELRLELDELRGMIED